MKTGSSLLCLQHVGPITITGIQPTSSRPISLRSILALSFHLLFYILGFETKSFVHISQISPMGAASFAHLILHDLITLIRRRVKIVKPFIMQYPLPSCHYLPPRSKNSLSTLVSHILSVWFEASVAVIMNGTVSWAATSCNIAEIYRLFVRKFRLNL